MTLRKNDIELLNRISENREEGSLFQEEDKAIYAKILDHSSTWLVDSHKDKEEAFDEILVRIDKDINTSSLTKVYRMAGIAAALAMLIVSSWIIYDFANVTRLDSGLAEIRTIYLPDSSRVILNAASKISYENSDWKNNNRKLKLVGQAFFDVKKGSDFRVVSDKGTVTVLGTSFNIYDRGETYKVECFTGKVQVEASNNPRQVYLTKGLKTELEKSSSSNLINPVEFDENKSIEWVSGVFNFYNAPLTEVFNELERQYGLRVHYKNVEDKFYTGTFDNKDLNRSILNICKPMGYTYVLEENNLTIINN